MQVPITYQLFIVPFTEFLSSIDHIEVILIYRRFLRQEFNYAWFRTSSLHVIFSILYPLTVITSILSRIEFIISEFVTISYFVIGY